MTFICWFAEQKQIIIIDDWLCDGFFTFLKSLFISKPFNPHQLLLQLFSNSISKGIKSCPFKFQEMDFLTLQTQINLHLSEICAAHYSIVYGAWHQHPNVCGCIVKAFVSNWSFTKKALVIFAIYRAMT